MTHDSDRYGTNQGHGHVWPRPDGMVVRCSGPPLCAECQSDARMVRLLHPDRKKVSADSCRGGEGSWDSRLPHLDELDGD